MDKSERRGKWEGQVIRVAVVIESIGTTRSRVRAFILYRQLHRRRPLPWR